MYKKKKSDMHRSETNQHLYRLWEFKIIFIDVRI